jgi:hypothetical protein
MYGVFTSGIPESVIDIALLWVPTGKNKRRLAGSGSMAHLKPSWSWAGWEGPVFHPIWPFKPPPDEDLCMLISLVQSFWIPSKDDDGYRLLHRHHELRPRRKMPPNLPVAIIADDSPKNWSLTAVPSHALLFRAFCAPLDFSESTNELRFCCGDEISLKLDSKQMSGIEILHAQKACGVLFGCTMEMLRDSDTSTLELVLLSEMEQIQLRERPIDLWQMLSVDSAVFPSQEWCSLNVLLVSWNGHYAERVGVGIVHREAWMALAPESKVIQLV